MTYHHQDRDRAREHRNYSPDYNRERNYAHHSNRLTRSHPSERLYEDDYRDHHYKNSERAGKYHYDEYYGRQHERDEERSSRRGHYQRSEYDSRGSRCDGNNSRDYSREPPKSTSSLSSAPSSSASPSCYIGGSFLSEERYLRDRRTVCVSQVAAKTSNYDLEKFFRDNNCKVKQARLVIDKSGVRHKGVAYVEFIDESFVRTAIGLTGTKLNGIPLVIQLTETEKNRLAQLQVPESSSSHLLQQKKIPQVDIVLCKVQIDSLHSGVDEFGLRQVLRPFGPIEDLNIMVDSDGRARGTAFCKYKNPLDAKEAVDKLQNFILMGMKLKLALVKDTVSGNSSNKREEEDFIPLTSQSRTELMLKWARSKNIIPDISLKIRNLPIAVESDYNLEADLKNELEKYGTLIELNLLTPGEAIVKFDDVAAGERAKEALHGRYFAYRQLQVEIIP
jgi:RNA-binding protein 39